MAMKYRGQNSVTALVCVIALLCIMIPFLAPAIIVVVVALIVGAIVDAKSRKREKQLSEAALTYLMELDQMTSDEFEKSMFDLICKGSTLGYRINGLSLVLDGMSIRYYQSVDNIGIAIVRKDYGDTYTPNSVIVTNRELTPKAREFCRNGMIVAITRTTIGDMYRYILCQTK